MNTQNTKETAELIPKKNTRTSKEIVETIPKEVAEIIPKNRQN